MTTTESSNPGDLAGSRETAFEQQMDLTSDPSVPGRYRVEVSPEWNCPAIPHGGIMAALAARGIALELGEDIARGMKLRSATTVFAARVPAGPVTIDVNVLRRGRSMSQATATVTADAADGSGAGHTTMAVFGRPRQGFEFTDLTPPNVPGPRSCTSFRDALPEETSLREPFPTYPIWEKMVEQRAALGHPPWEEFVPATSECAVWYRFDEPPVLADGTLDPLALVTLCDTMPQSVRERVGATVQDWYPPSADLTVHLLGEARSEWILAHKRARRSHDGYASLEIGLWDPTEGLVAHGSQMMFYVFPGEGPATP